MLFECNVGDKFEWIKGENFGKEDIVKNPKLRVGQMNFIEFVSGRRCSIQLAREYLSLLGTAEELEIENPEEFVKELAEKEGTATTKVEKGEPTAEQAKSPKTKSDNLYKDILDKIKSYEDVNLELNLKISLPKKAALAVLLEAYGEELQDELGIYIGEKIDEDVKAQIKATINTWIESLILIEDENN